MKVSGSVAYEQYEMKQLESFKRSLSAEDQVAVEATGNSRYFVNQIRGLVKEVHIVNPWQFRVIKDLVKKTDKKDAELLALFLSKGLLPEVRHKEELHCQLKSLAQTRDKLIKLRTTLKNKLHNILNAHGIRSNREGFSSQKGLERVRGYQLNDIAQLELEVIITQIEHLNEGISRLDQELEEKGQQLTGYTNITSIKGIGKKSGAILLSIIGDISDFEDDKKLSAYFGLVPRVSQSNETTHQGRITKKGSKLGRTILVQCVLVACRYSPYLNSFYQKIKAKKGSGKAIVAAARKLLSIIYYTLKNNWVFEDFTNFVIKET
jgi:transposase